MTVQVALSAKAQIGESITWAAAERAFYWIDVKAPALHRFRPDDPTMTRSWKLSSEIGAFALTETGDAVVALRQGLFRLNLATGALAQLAPPPFDPKLFRFNEGACDAEGRFWIGVMFDPVEGDPPKQKASLHSFTLGGGLREEPDAAELHNGMAWSPDGGAFFISHSRSGEIFAFDYDRRDGKLSNRRVFATVPSELGVPDGAAMDAEGGYWCALHGGGKLRRFNPDGSVDRDFELPVSQPTMPAFAGADLDALYLTSASDKLSSEARARQPHAGAVFRLDPGRRGVQAHYIVR